jgi:uroporphyrinogen decarboxylase
VRVTKKERFSAALAGAETDRIPFGAWMHCTVHEKTPREFARFTTDFQKQYDPDFVKVMYDWNYDTPVNFQFVQEPAVWAKLESFEPTVGAFARQIEALKIIRDSAGADVSVIQTVLSPFHIAHRLAYRRILQDLNDDPELVLNALRIIAGNYKRFAEACLREVGIDGFFFGAWGCESDWLSQEDYTKLITPSDHDVLETLRQAETVILHIHGEHDSYFDLLKDYPCDVISWEDRLAGPSIAEARMRTDKCLMGGVNHVAAVTASADEVESEARAAMEASGGKKFVLAPGCTFFNETPPDNILALKRAVSG